MPPMSDQGLTMVRMTVVLILLAEMAMPGRAEEKQDVMNEQERTARIQKLQGERARVESELRRLQSQPEGIARSTV